MLNIGSLVLGVGAWILGAFAIATSKTISSYRNTILSFVLCGSALVMQMFEINRRVQLGDYAAIEDTMRAVLIASCVLVVITVVLNVFALKMKKMVINRRP